MAFIKTQRKKRLEMLAWNKHKKRYYKGSGFYDVNCPKPKPWNGETIIIKCMKADCDNEFEYSGTNLYYTKCPKCNYETPVFREWIGVD